MLEILHVADLEVTLETFKGGFQNSSGTLLSQLGHLREED